MATVSMIKITNNDPTSPAYGSIEWINPFQVVSIQQPFSASIVKWRVILNGGRVIDNTSGTLVFTDPSITNTTEMVSAVETAMNNAGTIDTTSPLNVNLTAESLTDPLDINIAQVERIDVTSADPANGVLPVHETP